MKTSGNMLVGIIAAATAGVIIGMLIAPEKGSDLRKNIKDTAGDWTKKLADLLAEGKDQLTRYASSAISSGKETVGIAKPSNSTTV